ncbi:hypothetical protein HOK51_06675 [Candidatus Woesearchaeota archaeon]|jgi:type II pantothenate kinase|nr:hypothetical protein [Candidatus Woesearchaeota archaeon]MBT6519508.1 hypothetical protein [Candidatus Woesearchaeota archaeon]MBT7367415.1 hypothetical protein [Candidatus Woesearchaeota archaeon]
MNAGIDFGTTFTKAVWKAKDKDEYRFYSTAENQLEEIINQMKADDITQIYAAGINYKCAKKLKKEFKIIKNGEDKIQNEICLQVDGVRKLLNLKNKNKTLDEFLIVSIGSGTSYTLVRENKKLKFPFGSCIGGDFIKGLSTTYGSNDYNKMLKLANKGKSLDIKIKDLLPNKKFTFEGNLIISCFGKATNESKLEDIYHSIINCVAVSTIKDILVMNMIPKYVIPKNIVYIGSTIPNSPLKKLLSKYTLFIGKKAHFPKKPEYALAMGAYQQALKYE